MQARCHTQTLAASLRSDRGDRGRPLASAERDWHTVQMSDPVPHPYAIEVLPLAKPEGHFQWTIRRSGQLIERSDRPHRSEAKAHESAMEAIERATRPGADSGRR